MSISLKRAYDEPSPRDGIRILVDRLWPRGLTKEAAKIDLWLRDAAPSNELRKWFHARPAEWQAFRRKYLAELAAPQAVSSLAQAHGLLRKRRRITLLFASKNTERNNALVLKEELERNSPPISA
ncbi:MAG: DUF488 family protein [Acidobacteria bacterium]|nr:DUF488 family protein [Acidobacteriota bacterium]